MSKEQLEVSAVQKKLCLPSAALYKHRQSQAKWSCGCFRSAPGLAGWRYLCPQGPAAKRKGEMFGLRFPLLHTSVVLNSIFSRLRIRDKVDNLRVTYDEIRPMNLQRNTVKSKDLWKQLLLPGEVTSTADLKKKI